MFQGIVIGAVGGIIVGTIYGKYVLAEYNSLKAHVTSEIAALEKRLKG